MKSVNLHDLVPCKQCPRMIYFVTLKDGRKLPFNEDGTGHCHSGPKTRLGKFLAALEDFPKPARCGCENAVGVPTEGGEVRFNRVEWPWERHKCSRSLEFWDGGGIDFLAKWCSEIDPQPVLSVVVAVLKIRGTRAMFLAAIKTVTREKHCGIVEASRSPRPGSFVAWCTHGRSIGILTSGNLWLDWLADGCDASPLGLKNWVGQNL